MGRRGCQRLEKRREWVPGVLILGDPADTVLEFHTSEAPVSRSVPEWVRRPLHAIADALGGTTPEAPEAAPASPPEVVARARVMCVDDNPQVLRLLKKQLEDRYDVSVAQTAQDALTMLAASAAFDVIISDLRMPDVHGLTFLKMARELYPSTERIILTGLPDPAAVSDARASSSAEQLIVKPWTRTDLSLAVESAVLRRRESLASE